MKIKTSIEVDAELWVRFRRALREKYGREKGYKTEAIEEALNLWLEKQEPHRP